MFDLEYILLQIRDKIVVGEMSKFKVVCQMINKLLVIDVELIYQSKVQVDDEHTNKIVIDEKRKLGLVLNYGPSLGI